MTGGRRPSRGRQERPGPRGGRGGRRPTPDPGGRVVEPPPGTDPTRLDPDVRRALRSLTPEAAGRVAAHLVAAGDLLDENPRAALEQARAARALAARIGVVREAAGLAAYAAGEWQEALAELRAERRLTGSVVHLPVIADCERGLGRPERALEVARSPDGGQLDEAGRAELRIVEAGARRDLGQLAAAVATLQAVVGNRAAPQLWSARLWYAYADALLAVDRRDEAREWFAAVAEIDEGETDAEERLLELQPPPARDPD